MSGFSGFRYFQNLSPVFTIFKKMFRYFRLSVPKLSSEGADFSKEYFYNKSFASVFLTCICWSFFRPGKSGIDIAELE